MKICIMYEYIMYVSSQNIIRNIRDIRVKYYHDELLHEIFILLSSNGHTYIWENQYKDIDLKLNTKDSLFFIRKSSLCSTRNNSNEIFKRENIFIFYFPIYSLFKINNYYMVKIQIYIVNSQVI